VLRFEFLAKCFYYVELRLQENGDMMHNRDVINKITKERNPRRKRLKVKALKNSLLVWLLGGILAFLPTTVTFFKLPIAQLTFLEFFRSAEIIYICITMSIIVLCDGAEKKTFLGFWMNLIIIILGIALYSNIDQFPLFSSGNNLPALNLGLLCTVIIIMDFHGVKLA